MYSHPRLNVVCPPTQRIKASAQNSYYDAEDVCDLLNSRHQELMLDDAVEFLKRSALERVEEPDPKHEEKIVTVSMLTEGLEITESGNERTATTRQEIIRMLTVSRT